MPLLLKAENTALGERLPMTKISSPIRFSRFFRVDQVAMQQLGVFDPTLQADTKLFVDPILIRHSGAPEFSNGGSRRVTAFFTALHRLLRASNHEGDAAWNSARNRLQFHELSGTCLGYGGGSIHGSGWGDHLTAQLLHRAKEIIDAGVDDPELFLLIGLFSERVGPDRLSDMVTNIALPDIAAYTLRVCQTLGVPTEHFEVNGANYQLPLNPEQQRARTPVLLLPLDVLRELPIAFSVEDIWIAAAENEQIRKRMSDEVGVLWRSISREKKSDVLRALLKDPTYARDLIQRVLNSPGPAYDVNDDPRGLLVWCELAYTLGIAFPKVIPAPATQTVDGLDSIVIAIIEQFQFLIEHRDQWRILQDAPSRKTEKTAQMLFFAIAFSYCKANNLDVIPEADTGNGPVDFKFSVGTSPRILVELKLSKNDVQRGHDVQLPVYVVAEQADRAHYVVVDVGSLAQKWKKLQESRRTANQTEPRIWLVDSCQRASASIRR